LLVWCLGHDAVVYRDRGPLSALRIVLLFSMRARIPKAFRMVIEDSSIFATVLVNTFEPSNGRRTATPISSVRGPATARRSVVIEPDRAGGACLSICDTNFAQPIFRYDPILALHPPESDVAWWGSIRPRSLRQDRPRRVIQRRLIIRVFRQLRHCHRLSSGRSHHHGCRPCCGTSRDCVGDRVDERLRIAHLRREHRRY
jgi:hypothetical protein